MLIHTSGKWHATGWSDAVPLDERGLLLGAPRLGAASTASGTGSPTVGPRRSGARPAARSAAARVREPGRARAPPRAAPGCTDAQARRTARRSWRSRRACRGASRATRSATWRTTERSCAMKRYDSESRCCSSASRLRICAWIDTSSAAHRLVEHDEIGFERERTGDAHALALAARELVREPRHVLRPEADEVEQLGDALCRISAALRDDERLGDDRPAVIRGSSDAYGSWNTICTRRPAKRIVPDGRLDEPEHQPRDGRLAAARLPHERERLAARHREGHAVDRVHHASGACRKCLTTSSTSSRSVTAPRLGRRPRDGPAPAHASGGTAARHRSSRKGAARMERAPLGSAPGGSAGSPGCGARRAAALAAVGTDASRPRVYGCRGEANTSSTVPSSTTRPAYITTTRSAWPATTPRSWVTSRTASPGRRRWRRAARGSGPAW